MSVAVDVRCLDDVENASPKDSPQTRLDQRDNKTTAVDRPTSFAKLKPGSFDHAAFRETIRRAQSGDATAFESIYQRHASRVYALCLRMLRDLVEAEDLAQEVFLQLFRKLHTFRGESAFSTWLHRLTVNVVLMHLRKKSPPTVSVEPAADQDGEMDPPATEVGAPDLRLEGSINRLRLERCIAQLPPGYRAIFVLHDVQGYHHNEIAEMLGRSAGVSKSQLHKARRRLRELLQESQREKARNERLVHRKVHSQLSIGLPALPVRARLIEDRSNV